jgi:hypothetical protein
MISKSKLAIVAAVVAMGIVSPAFAQGPASGQGFARVYGTGNVGPTYYDHDGSLQSGTAPQQNEVAARRSGLSAFAKIPGAASGSYGGSAFGGASTGYNENLRTDQW